MKKPITRDPSKIQKVDNPWMDKLGKKRAKIIRKLCLRVNSLATGEVEIPFDIAVTSIDMIYRGHKETWFHDNNAEDCKLVVRLDGLDDEGIGMHLSETAKVVQWVLWNPLIGDPNTSRQAPDRVWRESEYSTPAEFLLSYVNTNKAGILSDLVADRWDAAMILGGAERVKTLIAKHIRSDNQVLKDSITQWMGRLKWHQDWDWEDICESTIFTLNGPKFDIFWEDESYEIPDSFYASEIWSRDNPYIAHNLRYIVTDVPGFEEIRETLHAEELKIQEWEQSQEGSRSNSAGSSAARSLDGLEEFSTPQRPIFKSLTRATSGRRAGFRPDMPYNGANKLAFDNHFAKHGVVVKKIKAPMPRPQLLSMAPSAKAPDSGRQKRKSSEVPVKSKKKKVEKRVSRKSKRAPRRKTVRTRRKRVKRRTPKKRVRRRSRSRSRSRSRWSARKSKRYRKPRYASKKRKAKRATRRRRAKKNK